MGVVSTSRWGAFLRSVTPDRRPGDYQHAACRILNGIAKRTQTTLSAPVVPLVRPKLLTMGTCSLRQSTNCPWKGGEVRKNLVLVRSKSFSAGLDAEGRRSLRGMLEVSSFKACLKACKAADPGWTSVVGCCVCHGKMHRGFV